jgi:hypothetical protein
VPGAITEANDAAGGMTVFIYGHPGTHKTSWAAQWPAPFFISVASEGGDDALKSYPQVAAMLMQKSQMQECPPVFNTAQPPRANIKHSSEIEPLIREICMHHKEWGVCTVVIDSLTYLVDLWLNDVIESRYKQSQQSGKKIAGSELIRQQDWGFLNNWLRAIRVHLNNAGLNVIWTCLQQDIFKTNPSNQAEMYLERSIPMLQGQSRVKLPGACKLHINAVATKVPHPGAMGRMMMQPTFYTAPDVNTDLRHKYAFQFPKGCLWDPEFEALPTFRAIWAELHEYIYVGTPKR